MRLLTVIFTFLSFLGSVSLWAQSANSAFANNRLIVKFKESLQNTLQTRQNNAFFSFGISEIDELNANWGCVKAVFMGSRGQILNVVLEFKNPIDIDRAIIAYHNTGKFEFVEPDFIVRGEGQEVCPPDVVPNDVFFSRQWGFKNDGTFSLSTAVAGKDIKAVDAWNVTTGSPSVVLCIIDTGCKLDHPDLTGRIWQNTKEIAGNGIDDDNNAKIDDTQGWDFVNNDNNPTDDYGHGSNVTGIVGSNGNNSLGYAGMDWSCKLMIVKCLDNSNNGLYSNIVAGLYYAVDNGAKVINLSLTGGSTVSASLESAVNYAWNKGVLIVTSMGNNNVNTVLYPAAYSNLIAVGSINPNGKRTKPFFWGTTSGSNYGSHIDVVAPGNYIYGISFNSGTNYGTYWGGTSQAAPYVSGLASLMLAKNKNLTPTQLKSIIEKGCDDQTGDPTEDTAGFDNFYGWGRINAKKTLDLVPINTGVNDLTDASEFLYVSPNPSRGVFTISFQNYVTSQDNDILRGQIPKPRGGGVVRILDISGRTVVEQNIQSIDKEWIMDIDLTPQPSGIYFVHLKTDTQFLTKKVVKL